MLRCRRACAVKPALRNKFRDSASSYSIAANSRYLDAKLFIKPNHGLQAALIHTPFSDGVQI